MNPTLEQLKAINSGDSELVVVAGPGSGKTFTLVERIARVVREGADPARIVILTFTNAAAGELAERLLSAKKAEQDLDSSAEDPEPWDLGFCGTLHSFALRMLRDHGAAAGFGPRISVISPAASEELLLQRARAIAVRPPPLSTLLEVKAGLGYVGGGRTRREFDLAETIVGSFRAEMFTAGLLDYDMLLEEFATCLESTWKWLRPDLSALFSHLFVDEVQDSSPADWRIYRALPIEFKSYVGDPDQAIYGFRGGSVAALCAVAQRLPVVRLEGNHRSRPEICIAAQRLIVRNSLRVEKETWSLRAPGGTLRTLPAAANPGEEVATLARWIRLCRIDSQSVAVLVRTNAIAEEIRSGLAGLGIPVVQAKTTPLPEDFGLARSFLELSLNPENDALASVFLLARFVLAGKEPETARREVQHLRTWSNARGLSINSSTLKLSPITRADIAIEALAEFSRETRAIAGEVYRMLPRGSTVQEFALALGNVRERVEEGSGDGVRVLTIHSAKGREFDAVFLAGFEDEAIPGRGDVEEERRLAYVGATRARELLFISHALTRSSKYVENQPRTPSRFIAELVGNP